MKPPTRSKRRALFRAIRAPEALCEAYDYPRPVPFSRGIRVNLEDHDLIFISGTASVNEKGKTVHAGNLAAQSRRTFENIKALLESEGADWRDIVRTTVYLKDMNRYHAFNRIRNEFYRTEGLNPLPASTCIQARLCRDDLLVEIEAIAIVRQPPPGPRRRKRRPHPTTH